MPVSIAHRICSVATVFVTATRRTSSGLRPALVAAAAMRDRTSAMFRWTASRSAGIVRPPPVGVTPDRDSLARRIRADADDRSVNEKGAGRSFRRRRGKGASSLGPPRPDARAARGRGSALEEVRDVQVLLGVEGERWCLLAVGEDPVLVVLGQDRRERFATLGSFVGGFLEE